MGNAFLYSRAVVTKERDDGKRSYDVGLGGYNHSSKTINVDFIPQSNGVILQPIQITLAPKQGDAFMLSSKLDPNVYQIFIPKIPSVQFFPVAYQYQTDNNGNRQMETMFLDEADLTLGES